MFRSKVDPMMKSWLKEWKKSEKSRPFSHTVPQTVLKSCKYPATWSNFSGCGWKSEKVSPHVYR